MKIEKKHLDAPFWKNRRSWEDIWKEIVSLPFDQYLEVSGEDQKTCCKIKDNMYSRAGQSRALGFRVRTRIVVIEETSVLLLGKEKL
jgi:hypothetical protein